MDMHGIRFSNRAKTSEGDDPAMMNAQFAAFAALCESLGLASYVRNVEYTSNCCVYFIDVDETHEHTLIGFGIEWAADKTLWQFEIFGRIEHKCCLKDDAS